MHDVRFPLILSQGNSDWHRAAAHTLKLIDDVQRKIQSGARVLDLVRREKANLDVPVKSVTTEELALDANRDAVLSEFSGWERELMAQVKELSNRENTLRNQASHEKWTAIHEKLISIYIARLKPGGIPWDNLLNPILLSIRGMCRVPTYNTIPSLARDLTKETPGRRRVLVSFYLLVCLLFVSLLWLLFLLFRYAIFIFCVVDGYL